MKLFHLLNGDFIFVVAYLQHLQTMCLGGKYRILNLGHVSQLQAHYPIPYVLVLQEKPFAQEGLAPSRKVLHNLNINPNLTSLF